MLERNQQEYDKTAAKYYDWNSHGVEGDVGFYIEEAKGSETPALEVGCGTGRVLFPLAEAGVEVVGLDRAAHMLGVARRKLSKLHEQVQSRIELVQGDMRNFSLRRQFALIIIPYRSFQHLVTPKDQRRALSVIHAHLTDGGRLVFNIADPDVRTMSYYQTNASQIAHKEAEFADPSNGNRVIEWAVRGYDPDLQVLEQDTVFEEINDRGQVLTKTYVPLRLRYTHRYEMRYLLELTGYKVEQLYGGFDRRPFGKGGEQIWVARKTS